ncbi:MAG: hypothetical protein NWR50_03110 [Crocinitomicaceae bacterium]|jgi:hypothetical protein|nr:hypothetical protein [Crocinitomicaceae bacterium]
MKKLFLPVLVISTFTFCKKSKNNITPVCDGSNPTYTNFVADLIASKCASCHDYSTYAKLSAITSNGQFTNTVLTDQTMPKNNSISEADLNKLQCWVENGFPEN